MPSSFVTLPGLRPCRPQDEGIFVSKHLDPSSLGEDLGNDTQEEFAGNPPWTRLSIDEFGG